jgi:hypothetical protein
MRVKAESRSRNPAQVMPSQERQDVGEVRFRPARAVVRP